MNLSRQHYLESILDAIIITALSLIILAYSLFGAKFAELALNLSFLSFPIFVGEILLGVSLAGLAVKLAILNKQKRLRFNKWHAFVLAFSVWILIKAFWGYYQYGPLAFRNAALFYYFWFAIIGYYFFFEKYIADGIKLLILSLIGSLLFTGQTSTYYWWFYTAVFAVVVGSLKGQRWRYVAVSLLFILLIVSFSRFFVGSRSHLVSMLSVFVFLLCTVLILYNEKLNKSRKTGVAVGVLVLLSFGLIRFADHNEIISMTTPREVIRQYQEKSAYIKEREKDFQFRDLDVQLYHPNARQTQEDLPKVRNERVKKVKEVKEKKTAKVPEPEDSDASETGSLRSLDNAYGNIIFRLLIWRDMIVEMAVEKAWLGINFGKPQRSKSIEISRWAYGEWTRDGWITPHNSFLHMVYRGGIIGAVFIGFIFYVLFQLVKDFIQQRSFQGILLVSILVYWIVLSQFLVILEFPYFAIPFWTIFGATLAYSHQLQGKYLSEGSSRP